MRALRSSIRIAQVDGIYAPAIIFPIYTVDAHIAVWVMYVCIGRATVAAVSAPRLLPHANASGERQEGRFCSIPL